MRAQNATGLTTLCRPTARNGPVAASKAASRKGALDILDADISLTDLAGDGVDPASPDVLIKSFLIPHHLSPTHPPPGCIS